MLAFWSVLLPVLTGLAAYAVSSGAWRERVHMAGSLATTGVSLWLVGMVAAKGSVTGAQGFFHADALSAIVLLIIALVSVTAAFYSVGYIRHELRQRALTDREARQYYALYHLFVATMIWVTVVNNMGLLWVGVEATTVVSAFLVAIYPKGEALEAAWKYLIICSAGIALALLGVIMVYASSIAKLGTSNHVLDWTVLSNPHLGLQPDLVALAFVFIMVGFGTKVGFAPMHFWLPDAHSQAPSPVSALLSGALLNTALLGLIRFGIVAEHAVHGHLIQHLFIGFGLLSVLVAFPFILVQQDFKRMLAFSTVEHMGIIAVALGIGGPLGYFAALLQMFNHAMGKSLLFLTAGNVNQKYETKQIDEVAGLIRVMPFTGLVLLVGTLAITGVPPFNLFTSEYAIFVAGFQRGQAGATGVLAALVAMIFAAMMLQTVRMVFGRGPALGTGPGEISRWTTLPLLLPLSLVLSLGVFAPSALTRLIHQGAAILAGGGLT